MPDPNPNHVQIHANLTDALSTMASHGATAAAAYETWYEQPQPPDPENDPCPALNQAKANAETLLASINAALQAVPCNVI